MRRQVWIGMFLALTFGAVGMELWAAADTDPNTVTWSELVGAYVPQTVAVGAASLLAAWIVPHIRSQYRSSPGGAMSKVRKAVMAFFTAAVGAVVTKVVTDGMPGDSAGWFGLVGAAVAVGLAAAYAVWRVPNAPAVVPPANDPIRRTY